MEFRKLHACTRKHLPAQIKVSPLPIPEGLSEERFSSLPTSGVAVAGVPVEAN